MRGFDYYTGIVFEIFDKNPENRRSVFGGGRYDGLTSLFEGSTGLDGKISAVGFGAGDVVARDLMETYGKLTGTKKEMVNICITGDGIEEYTNKIGDLIRKTGVGVAVDYSGKKLGDQIKAANKNRVSMVVIIGEEEMRSNNIKVKNLESGEESVVAIEDIDKYFVK
jgi:histidyl-tRNA synthetase